jgi:hypothetical protein
VLRLAAFASACAILLSGCTGEGASTSSSPTPPAPTADVDAQTGGVEGIVTDTELEPIAGATIWLKDVPDAVAKTSADGRYALGKLAPASYVLLVERVGYQAARRDITLLVGEVVRADFTLNPIILSVPFHATKEERGIGGCSFAWRPAAGSTDSLGVCGLATSLNINTGLDRFIIDWKLNGPFAEWQSGIFEMDWKPNQFFGRGMQDRWEGAGCSVTNADARLATTSGPPPHTARVLDIKGRIDFNVGKGCSSFSACKDPCGLQSRVFPTPDTLGTSAPADVGVVFQQTFTQYFSDFYSAPAPESFSALADA